MAALAELPRNFAEDAAGWATPGIMQTICPAGTMIGLIVTAAMTGKIKDVRFSMVFPGIRGRVMALVMIVSSLCSCTILTAAAGMASFGVMTMNIVLAVIGVLPGIIVNRNNSRMPEAAERSR